VQQAIKTNTLFYGDNLPILREYIAPESVDLIYLDPPFNSNRSYNVLFRDESGKQAEAQIGWGRDYPRIQILTIEELLHSAQVKMPPQYGTFKEAQQVQASGGPHPQLEF
jgi:DNA modification methylase